MSNTAITHPSINRAWEIATDAHKRQFYGDKPYTWHLLSVDTALMSHIFNIVPSVRFQAVDDTILAIAAREVALLHDVIEDSEYTAKDLYDKGVTPQSVQAVECLSKNPNEGELAYYLRIGEGRTYKGEVLSEIAREMAIAIKVIDRTENIQAMRTVQDPAKREKLYKKYIGDDGKKVHHFFTLVTHNFAVNRIISSSLMNHMYHTCKAVGASKSIPAGRPIP